MSIEFTGKDRMDDKKIIEGLSSALGFLDCGYEFVKKETKDSIYSKNFLLDALMKAMSDLEWLRHKLELNHRSITGR